MEKVLSQEKEGKNKYKYEGDFVDGNFEVHGVLNIEKDSAYEGEFRGGKKNGNGKITYYKIFNDLNK